MRQFRGHLANAGTQLAIGSDARLGAPAHSACYPFIEGDECPVGETVTCPEVAI